MKVLKRLQSRPIRQHGAAIIGAILLLLVGAPLAVTATPTSHHVARSALTSPLGVRSRQRPRRPHSVAARSSPPRRAHGNSSQPLIPGDPDPDFGTGGIVDTVFGQGPTAYGLAVQPDDKIVATGDVVTSCGECFTLLRYLPDGTLDPSFGAGGFVTTLIGLVADTNAVVLQPDGKIVAVGYSEDPTTTNWGFTLARYLPSGAIDTSFGSGGIVITKVQVSSQDFGWSVALQSDGKLVLAGTSGTQASCNGTYTLVRYLASGALDTTFGTGGIVTTSVTTTICNLSVAVRSTGQILLAGGSASGFTLMAFTSAGVPDTTFGSGGTVTTKIGVSAGAWALTLQPDNNIVTAGSSTDAGNVQHLTLARYLPSGALDTSFGSSGIVLMASGVAYAVAIQSDGKILAGGAAGTGTGALAVVRFLANGNLDSSFGTGGVASVPSQGDAAWALGIQSGGNIVAFGEFFGSHQGFGLVRYLGGISTTLTVDVQGANAGTVTSSPAGINCGGGNTACSETTPYSPGATVTLTATPATGGAPFGGWQGACTGTATTCMLTQDAANKHVTALFGTVPSTPQLYDVYQDPGTGAVTLSWIAPNDGGLPLTGYTITANVHTGSQGPVSYVARPDQTQLTLSGLLGDCASTYIFGIVAQNALGNSPAGTNNQVVQAGGWPTLTGNQPQHVVIFVRGVNSSTRDQKSGETWDPLSVNYCRLGTESDPTAPWVNHTKDLASIADSFDASDPLAPGITPNFTDSVAADTGAVLLPFSYTGSTLVQDPGSPDGALFVNQPYAWYHPWIVDPASAASLLEAEVNSVHTLWPSANIVIVGHSEGGLVAEQYFENYWLANHEGVTHIFSLDSPVNGAEGAATFENLLCALPNPVNSICPNAGIFPNLAARWLNKDGHDPDLLTKDAQAGYAYTPIGTRSDKVWDYTDAAGLGICPGLDAQLLYNSFKFCPTDSSENPLVSPPDVLTPQGPGNVPAGDPQWAWIPAFGSDIPHFLSHGFVMRSRANVNLVIQAINAGAGATAQSQWLADLRHAQQLAAKSPRVVQGTLSATVVSIGQSETISGSGFGATAGSVYFTGASNGLVSAAVSSWSDAQIVVTVPSGAQTGAVFITTAIGEPGSPGTVTVLASANAVASLQVQPPASPSLNGQPETVLVTALDGGGHPVANVAVNVSDGETVQTAQSDASGVATFSLIGYATVNYVAFSGAVSSSFSLNWQAPPQQSLTLAASATSVRALSRVTLTATVKDGSGNPVAGQSVTFLVGGPSSIMLSSAQATTDSGGVATITASSQVAASATILAVTDDNSVTAHVAVTWTPYVMGVSPLTGPAAGGTFVTIHGFGFSAGSSVSFGNSAATRVTVVNSTTITCLSPAGSGVEWVVVTTAGGATRPSAAAHFIYPSVPLVRAIAPSVGPTAGGTVITITGQSFTSNATVTFGGVPASSVVVHSRSSITATAPASTTPGTVDVLVTTALGTSAIATADRFTYVASPTVTAVTPDAGAAAGGATVTISGTGFMPGALVAFGGVAATSIVVTSATSITVTAPAGAGTVDVTVTTPGGPSATSRMDLYTYQ